MTNVLLTGSLESFIQLLGALFIFAVVLAATYLTTRWMGGMQRGRQNNKNLHVIAVSYTHLTLPTNSLV
mgnify:CR=1 FL=1